MEGQCNSVFPLFCFLTIVLFLIPAVSWSANFKPAEEISLDADRLYFDQERRLYVAEGNVEFASGSMVLTCDFAEYSDLTGAFTAEGNVVFTDEKGTVLCNRVEWNARTRLGTFYAAEMDNVKKDYFLKGDRIDMVGEESYRIQKGSITECGKKRPLWEIRGKTLWVTKGEYVTSKHMTLWLGGIPVFYSPYFVFPIKTKRQSGFLPPIYGRSRRNGKIILTDYFWALDSSRDATFSYAYLEDNGNRFGLEYRYAVNRGVRGTLFGKYIHDRNADREGSRIAMNQDRWEIGMTHYHNLQDRIYGGVFADVFSDGHYLTDFSGSSEARVRLSGQSDLVLVSRWDGGNVAADFQYFQEMGVRREMTTLQSLPEVRVDLTPSRVRKSNWFYSLDSSFVNFWRQEGYESTFSTEISSDPSVLMPDTPARIANLQKLTDAGFDAVTSLRYQGIKGRRFDVSPTLSLPLDLADYLVFTPRIGYNETLYNRSAFTEDFVDRGVLNAGFNLSARAHRDFPLGTGGSLRHILEPEIFYDYRQDQDKDEVPIFDEVDRLDRLDEVHLKLTNRFLWTRVPDREHIIGDQADAKRERREIAILKLDALYDRLLTKQKFRSIAGELGLNLIDDLYIEINTLYDFTNHDFERLNFDLKYKVDETFFFQVGKRFTEQVPVETNRPTGSGEFRSIGGGDVLKDLDNEGISFWTASLNWEPIKNLSMTLTGYFNGLEDTGDDYSSQLSYESKCWGITVTAKQYDDLVQNDFTGELEIDRVNEIFFFFTIKSLKLRVFSKEPGE